MILAEDLDRLPDKDMLQISQSLLQQTLQPPYKILHCRLSQYITFAHVGTVNPFP